MDYVKNKKPFTYHVKSISTSNMLVSPQSTHTPQTGRSITQFVQQIQPVFDRKQMRSLLKREEREYYKRKEIIESGHLTSRGLTKFLKPYRLKWQKNDLKQHDTILQTKLNIADIILNAKGGQNKREILIEKISNQMENPRQILSQRIIKSERTVQLFMDRLKFQSIPIKLRGDAQSPTKTVQSQKLIFNSSTTYQTE